MGNQFLSLNFGAVFAIGPNGYKQISVPVTYGGAASMVFYSQSIDITTPPSPKFGVSNLQVITLTP